MICGGCLGEKRTYWATGFDDRDGLILYESRPCEDCRGTGLAEPPRSGMVIVWVAGAIAFIGALVGIAYVIAQRPPP